MVVALQSFSSFNYVCRLKRVSLVFVSFLHFFYPFPFVLFFHSSFSHFPSGFAHTHTRVLQWLVAVFCQCGFLRSSNIAHHGSEKMQASPEKQAWSCSYAKKVQLYSSPDDVEFVQMEAPSSMRIGPRDQMERLTWPDEAWDCFDAEERWRLIRNVARTTWTDYFAGWGSRDQICLQLGRLIARKTQQEFMLPQTWSHTEFDPARHKILGNLKRPHKARHLRANILHRLGEDVVKNLAEQTPDKNSTTIAKRLANADRAKLIDDVYAAREPDDAGWGYCDNHCDEGTESCRILPTHEECQIADCDCGPELIKSPLVAVSAGIPCVDNSVMSNLAEGDAGPTWLASHTMIADIANADPAPDLIISECTPRWNAAPIASAHFGARTRKVLLRGQDIGDRYSRPRADTVSTHKRVVWVKPLEKFLATLGSRPHPAFTVSDMWQNDEEQDVHEMKEVARLRVLPVDASLDDTEWHELLHPTQQGYLAEYHRLFTQRVHAGKCNANDAWICDLDQKPTGPKSKLVVESSSDTLMPTLICHQTLFHSKHRRPLSALDHARAHCWPVGQAEISACGCLFDIEAMLLDNTLTHSKLKKIVGDSWHLRQQGLLFAYVLANIELQSETHLVRQPSFTDLTIGASPPKRQKLVRKNRLSGSTRSRLTISIGASSDSESTL